MIKTVDELLIFYSNYADPIGKINREIKKGNIFPVIKGLYETNSETPGQYLAAYIYGPSYLSFEYALSFHNLIPEAVYVYTNATFNKRKSKTYKNVFGIFTYRDVPSQAYPYDIKIYENEGYVYFIATPEKAICDKLYTLAPVTSIKALKTLLFSDLRIDKTVFDNLDFNEIIKLCDYYKSTNLKLLKKYAMKEIRHDNH